MKTNICTFTILLISVFLSSLKGANVEENAFVEEYPAITKVLALDDFEVKPWSQEKAKAAEELIISTENLAGTLDFMEVKESIEKLKNDYPGLINDITKYVEQNIEDKALKDSLISKIGKIREKFNNFYFKQKKLSPPLPPLPKLPKRSAPPLPPLPKKQYNVPGGPNLE